eukprot:3193089-Prymnesium_polylepis.1
MKPGLSPSTRRPHSWVLGASVTLLLLRAGPRIPVARAEAHVTAAANVPFPGNESSTAEVCPRCFVGRQRRPSVIDGAARSSGAFQSKHGIPSECEALLQSSSMASKVCHCLL